MLWVTCGLGQGLSVTHIAGEELAPLGLQKAWLVCTAVELEPTPGEVLLVFIVTLNSASVEEMLHPWVITDAAVPNLQAPVPQEGLFIPELEVRGAERDHKSPCPPCP